MISKIQGTVTIDFSFEFEHNYKDLEEEILSKALENYEDIEPEIFLRKLLHDQTAEYEIDNLEFIEVI